MLPDFSQFRVRPTEVTTAKELYDILDENNSLWRHGEWIFRGQPDASKALLPTALRGEFMDNYVRPIADRFVTDYIECQREKKHTLDDLNLFTKKPTLDGLYLHSDDDLERYFHLATHIAVEKCIVWAFELLADRAALDVPHERESFWGGIGRSSLDGELAKIFEEKPRKQQFLPNQNVFALARHHALPVRMLDWTVRPHFAAFFAADQELSCDQESDYLVVWAVDRVHLEEQTSLALFAPLRTPIGFLKSQEGLFMYDKKADEKFMQEGYWEPFEHRIRQYNQYPFVYKFLLPRSERESLLHLLRLRGISKSKLMPSYDNVAYEITSGRIDWSQVLLDFK